MAKQLLTAYTFTPGAANVGTVIVPGTYTLERFLLITNVTTGDVIYQFNKPAKGATLSTGGGNTTLTLESDTSAMSASHRLQVFIDDASPGGGLTDTQLRATPVPVSGSVSISGTPSVSISGTAAVSGPLTDTQLRATAVPVTGTFWQPTQPISGSVSITGTPAVTISGTPTVSGPLTDVQLRATAVPVSVSGVATAANQATGNTSLNNLDVDLGAQADAAATTDTGTFSLISLFKRQLGNWTTLLGRVPSLTVTSTRLLVDGSGVTQPVSGTFWQATQPVSGAVTANAGTNLNTSALALETGGNLATLTGRVPAQGQAAMAASLPVAIASDQAALAVNSTPAAALLTSYSQAGVIAINTILRTLDCSQYRSVSIQCTAMGTSGVVTPEWSNDNATWLGATILTQAGATATTFNAAGLWVAPVQARYLRLRLSTATTAGTTTLSIHQFDDSRQFWLATQPVSGTVTSNIGTGTVAAVTSANLALPGITADVASAALTSTATAGPFTPTFGTCYSVNIPVTAVTGTTPTLDVAIEESDDSGTNWFKVYDFPRITAAGMYRSPIIRLTGNRVRYVQTVSGTTPSFTRSINRLQCSSNNEAVRQLIDRSIVLTTLNSTTPSLDTRDAGNRAQLVVNIGAATTAPALQMEGSDDNGASWYAIGTPLTAVASSTVQLTVTSINAALMRVRVSTAGATVTAGYVMIKAHD